MEKKLVEIIYAALSKPHAITILRVLHEKGSATLTEIMVELKTLSKYRSIRNTVDHLVDAGLVHKEVKTKGAIKSWKLTLTKKGKELIKIIHEEILRRAHHE